MSKLHVIHFSSDTDLPQSVRDQIPDAVGQTLFRNALNHALAYDNSSEMHAYIRAWKALQDAGYARTESKTWEVAKYSEDQPRDDHGRFGSGGSAPTNNYATAPRVFKTKDAVEEKNSWGEKYFEWKDRPGQALTGTPLSHNEIPENLYHVTTAADKVESSGVLLGQRSDVGLGGGQEDGVSFTTDRGDARVIERELGRAVSLAQGKDTVESIARYAREDEKEAGLPEGTLQKSIDSARKMYDVNASMSYYKDNPEKLGSLAHDAFNSYLVSREFAATGIPILKNPILFSNRDTLKSLDPTQIKVLSVPKANIPDSALITTGSDKFLHEVRAYSDVPVKNGRVLKFQIQKDSPGLSDVHVDRPLGSDDEDEKDKPDKYTEGGALSHEQLQRAYIGDAALHKYLPPAEVHAAAKSAYDAGTSVLDITASLAEGDGLTYPRIAEIAKHFEDSASATDSEVTRNAWGGHHARKWALRVLRKVEKDEIDKGGPGSGPRTGDGLINSKNGKYTHIGNEPSHHALAVKMGYKDLDDAYDHGLIRHGTMREDQFFSYQSSIKAHQAVLNHLRDAERNAHVYIDHYDPKAHKSNSIDGPVSVIRAHLNALINKTKKSDEIDKTADNGKGIMVSFTLDPAIGSKLAVPDGESPDDMHVTLLYLGKDVDPVSLPVLDAVLTAFARRYAPVSGTIAGPIRFPANEHTEGRDVAVASFENADIQDFRRQLKDAVEAAGFDVK